MKTHREIEERSLILTRAIVNKIDADPQRAGIARARTNCQRWYDERHEPAVREWIEILEQPWESIRGILLDATEEGRRLRQSNPFCGILTPRERWRIYKDFHSREAQ